MMIAPYPVQLQLMDATVLNNALVLVHHVIMSMDATKQEVGKIHFLSFFENIYMNWEL